MYVENQLPKISLPKAIRLPRPDAENVDHNTLPSITTRERISFGCIKGFLKLRIMNARKKTYDTMGRYETLPTERTIHDADIKTVRGEQTLQASYYDPRPLANTNKKFLGDAEKKKPLETHVKQTSEKLDSKVARKMRAGSKKTARSSNIIPMRGSFRDFSVPRIHKAPSIKLTGSH